MKRKDWKRGILSFLLVFCMVMMCMPENVKAAQEKASISVYYSGHMQTFGELAQVKDGITLGKMGMGKRMEAISIQSKATLTYCAHVQGIGWQKWKINGQIAGTTGQARRLEAIRIKLTGVYAKDYDIYYRSHLCSGDWLGWAKNGAISGTCGYGAKLDGIQIIIVAKGQAVPGATEYTGLDSGNPPEVVYRGHAQTYGDLFPVKNGAMLGTIGQGKRLEALSISLANKTVDGGITYRVHGQTYGWQGYHSDGELAGTIGQAKRIEAVEMFLTGDLARFYDIYYRVHIQKYGWLDWAKNGAPAGSTGKSLRVEAIQIKLVARSGSAPGKTETPFVKTVFDMAGKDRVVKGIGYVDLWLGDSRMVGFGGALYGYAVRNESFYPNLIAKVSAGYVWLNKTGYGKIAAILDKKPNAVIVSNFGINDINNYENYLAFYKKLHANYPNATICIMSVNPVGPNFRYSNNYGNSGFNANICAFNSFMKAHVADFDGYYIDTYYGVNPETVSDGVHYTNATCHKIYRYVTGEQ